MQYTVTMKKRVVKTAAKMPATEQKALRKLIEEMVSSGPVRADWPSYSKLGKNEHHCHLSYHWVACWRHEAGTIEIEVYYAGSRENAPY